jgi:hypothetical protein
MDAPNSSKVPQLSGSETKVLKDSTCLKCVEIQHNYLHRNSRRGCFSGPDTYNCKKEECILKFRDLLSTGFQRLEDCNHNRKHPSQLEAASASTSVVPSRNSKNLGASPKITSKPTVKKAVKEKFQESRM